MTGDAATPTRPTHTERVLHTRKQLWRVFPFPFQNMYFAPKKNQVFFSMIFGNTGLLYFYWKKVLNCFNPDHLDHHGAFSHHFCTDRCTTMESGIVLDSIWSSLMTAIAWCSLSSRHLARTIRLKKCHHFPRWPKTDCQSEPRHVRDEQCADRRASSICSRAAWILLSLIEKKNCFLVLTGGSHCRVENVTLSPF